MRNFALTATILAATTGTAFAEGGHVPPPLPPVIVENETDWTGAYIGLGVGMWSALDRNTGGFETDYEDVTAPEIFGGYLYQSGSFVFGGEVSYSIYEQNLDPAGPVAGVNRIVDMLDVSARLGVTTGDLLIYGIVGASLTTVDALTIAGQTTTDMTGYHFGIGADYRVSDQFSIGVRYVERRFEDIELSPFSAPLDYESSSISLRATFHF